MFQSIQSLLPSDRDGEVEYGEHLGPHVLDEEIGDESGCDGGVGRLAHPNQAAEQQEQTVVLGL